MKIFWKIKKQNKIKQASRCLKRGLVSAQFLAKQFIVILAVQTHMVKCLFIYLFIYLFCCCWEVVAYLVSLTKTIGAILHIYSMQLIRLNASNESATRKLKTYVERSIRAAYRRVSQIYHFTWIFAYWCSYMLRSPCFC